MAGHGRLQRCEALVKSAVRLSRRRTLPSQADTALPAMVDGGSERRERHAALHQLRETEYGHSKRDWMMIIWGGGWGCIPLQHRDVPGSNSISHNQEANDRLYAISSLSSDRLLQLHWNVNAESNQTSRETNRLLLFPRTGMSSKQIERSFSFSGT